VLDTTSVLTVDFYSDGGTVESVTLGELNANPKLNLLWIARTTDGEGEYVQFETATPQSTSAPFVSRYQLTNLLRGRFNTAGNVGIHLTGDDVVLMNSAIKVVPMDSSRLAIATNYKFVTVGQDPDDAPIVSNTWRGYSLKAEKPASMSGVYDLANGSLVLDWIDNTVLAPTADDSFDVEIRSAANGGGTVLRGPIQIKPNDLARASSTPPLASASIFSDPFFPLDLVTSLPSTAYDWIEPGGFTAHFTKAEHNGGGTVAVAESTPFNLSGNTHLETQVPILNFDPTHNQNILPSFMGLYGPNSNFAGWFRGESETELLQVHPSTSGFLSPPVYTVSPGDRLSVLIQADGTVVYYINYLGAMSDPWWVSPVKLDPAVEYKVFFYYRGTFLTAVPTGTDITVGVRNTRWLRNIPEFTYTGDMQTSDNSGSLPSVVHVAVRKRSVHPLGPASDWLYQSFTR
jgi:hypothetical protein